MPIGAYDKAWLDIHTTPEQAVQAHQLLKGETVIPIHWATFDLALHTWYEPIERFVAEARKQGVSFVTPVVGEQVLLQTHINQFWWRKVSN